MPLIPTNQPHATLVFPILSLEMCLHSPDMARQVKSQDK